MRTSGPDLKTTVYLNEDTGGRQGFLLQEIRTYLHKSGIDGPTVFRAHASDVEGLHVPVLIESRKRAEVVLPRVLELVTDGLMEVRPTEILKHIVGRERVVS